MKRKKSRTFASTENNLMHDLNPYKNSKPDFKTLAQKYPELQQCLVHRGDDAATINWAEPLASRLVSEILLMEDFGLTVKFASDRLCPPLPNRINYLCWLQETFKLCCIDSRSGCSVLDIGVGASCIYPLLGNKLFHWSFVGSDIDSDSVLEAREVVINNNLQEHISIVSVANSDTVQNYIAQCLPTKSAVPGKADDTEEEEDQYDESYTQTLPSFDWTILCRPENRGPVRAAVAALGGAHLEALVELEKHVVEPPKNISLSDIAGMSSDASLLLQERPWFTASMTNPPFYDLEEVVNIRSSCTGRYSELCTPGGEICFLLAIYADSKVFRERISWYSCMTGKKSTAKLLLKHLNSEGLVNVRSTRFFQGSTTRWGIAWSFSNLGLNHLSDSDKVFAKPSKKKKLETTLIGGFRNGFATEQSATTIHCTMHDFESTKRCAERSILKISEESIGVNVGAESLNCGNGSGLADVVYRVIIAVTHAYQGFTSSKSLSDGKSDKVSSTYPPRRMFEAQLVVIECSVCGSCLYRTPISEAVSTPPSILLCRECTELPGTQDQTQSLSVAFTEPFSADAANVEGSILFITGFQAVVRHQLHDPAPASSTNDVDSAMLESPEIQLKLIDLSAHESMNNVLPGIYKKLFTLLKDKTMANFLRNNRQWRRQLSSDHAGTIDSV